MTDDRVQESMEQYLHSFIGTKYHWGGDDPLEGFDCSGFALEFLMAFGIFPNKTPKTRAHDLYLKLKAFPESFETGAIAFYGKPEDITHVAVCRVPGLVVEAGGGGSDTVDDAAVSRRNAYIRIRPVQYRKDFVGSYMPDYKIGNENPFEF